MRPPSRDRVLFSCTGALKSGIAMQLSTYWPGTTPQTHCRRCYNVGAGVQIRTATDAVTNCTLQTMNCTRTLRTSRMPEVLSREVCYPPRLDPTVFLDCMHVLRVLRLIANPPGLYTQKITPDFQSVGSAARLKAG